MHIDRGMLSVARQAQIAATIFMATCLLAISPASAQLSVSDNELRTNVNEFAKRIKTNNNRIDSISASLERLRQENELLRNLLEQVLAATKDTSAKAELRAQRINAINAEIVVALEQIEAEQSSELATLEKVIEGVDAQAYTRALVAYSKQGQVEKALAELNDIVALGGPSIYLPAAMHWIGRIHFEQGQFAQARSTLTKLLDKYPGSAREAETLAILAEISTLTGDPDATRWQQRLQFLHPGTLETDRINALLPPVE